MEKEKKEATDMNDSLSSDPKNCLFKEEINNNKNEIICVYNKKNKDWINILHDYKYFENDYKESYNEAKNNINEENIEIYVNDKKIIFNYKYESDEIGPITIKFKFIKLLTSTAFMFYNCESLESIDLSSFNTNNVTNMSYMFYNCESLESLDLSSFNTNNVTNMSHMFSGCKSLKIENIKIKKNEEKILNEFNDK